MVGEMVRITEVSPRDGLQNEPGVIPTTEKVGLVELLCATGVDEIEVTSFVSAKWVPQLGDAAEVVKGLACDAPAGRERMPILSALVPNEVGLRGAQAANRAAGRRVISKVAVFTAASETFARRNTNATIAETIERFGPVVRGAIDDGLAVRGYVSCVIACPFEGPIEPARVIEVAARLIDLGVTEIDLGDTIGAGTADSTRRLLEAYARRWPIAPAGGTRVPVTMHFHDTFGRAGECVRASLDLGVRSFDGSAAGLGGCPYATKKLPDGTVQRAPGNISTEALVRTIHAAGYRTGVDLDALERAAEFARGIVSRSRAGAAGGAA